jgi:DNA polymerase-1
VQFITRTLEEARDTGCVKTILGRRRAVSGVRNTDRMRSQPERIAVNAVIQGSAADLIKQAMIDLDTRLCDERYQARMLLQIHDELVFEAPDSEIDRLARLVDECMTRAITFRVPIRVAVSKCPNWLDVQPVRG